MRHVIDDFLGQVRWYERFTNRIKFVFKGSVPDTVREALEREAGNGIEIIVEIDP